MSILKSKAEKIGFAIFVIIVAAFFVLAYMEV